MDRWMQSQGLTFDHRELLGTGALGGHFTKNELLDLIANRVAIHNPSYAFISFSGHYAGLGEQGHVVAGVFTNVGVRFFDPNYGEFTFPSMADFREFFRWSFRKSYYGSSMLGNMQETGYILFYT